MPAVLGNNIVDGLLPIVDAVRAAVLPLAGVRQFRVYVVKRTYASRVGEGSYTESSFEITPRPDVQESRNVRFDLRPEGKMEEGDLLVSEISLAGYTEAELAGTDTNGRVPANVLTFWKVSDGQGQSIRNRAYKLAAPLIPDRTKTLGWVALLRRAEGVQV